MTQAIHNAAADSSHNETASQAPWPGSHEMPQWDVGELIDAPRFGWRNWMAMLGPAVLMAGSAIGGGEWLMGPTVTAKYGGALMWLASLSILAQVVYNVEICRYTLYTGEPIFTGKFRTLPGPHFWVLVYLIVDIGSLLPYLAANAATPVVALYLGRIPDSTVQYHKDLMRYTGVAIFLLSFIPLIFGGKIYNALRRVMAFKIVVVLGFLLILGLFYSKASTWSEIFSGFFKVGTVPIERVEDLNGNGILDAGEDWDGDGKLDIIEPKLAALVRDTDNDGAFDSLEIAPGQFAPAVWVDDNKNKVKEKTEFYPDVNKDGKPDTELTVTPPGKDSKPVTVNMGGKEKQPKKAFIDYDNDGIRDGDNVQNVFVAMLNGQPMPKVDLSMIAFLGAFAAIAGSGGLSNTPTSNYTRDQGWGMGHHVGAIPSIVGGQNLQLSHVGMVFEVTPEVLPRWKRWYRHVLRDQLVVWMPACFLGVALPSMLSVEFLPRGIVADNWTAAGMTADGVRARVSEVSGVTMGQGFWYMTLICGFLVLGLSVSTNADGYIRRWVDVFWTSSKTLRNIDPANIKYVYFGVMCLFLVTGVCFLLSPMDPTKLVKVSTNILNFALGFSCWHTLVLNHILLPKALRPGWFMSICLFLSGVFFWFLAIITAMKELGLT
ncbi:MAG: Nramp family divalent metal transporter [Planctomycetales bacterium]